MPCDPTAMTVVASAQALESDGLRIADEFLAQIESAMRPAIVQFNRGATQWAERLQNSPISPTLKGVILDRVGSRLEAAANDLVTTFQKLMDEDLQEGGGS